MRALPLQLGALLAGKYRIDAVLGTGGMGTVFAAENVDLGRAVAIKVLHEELAHDPDLARRLRQEARAAATIGHPGIVDVLDLGTTDSGAPFIVMERLEGESLGARLAHRRRLTPAIAVGILMKAIEALAAAHGKGIIHRDLKPDNIFLTVQPQAGVKLVDFGISKQVTSDLTVTTSGVVMGTPLYMSPEQARGARDVTTATDLYSIGVILYQALSGTPPHVAHNYNEMLAMILQHEPLPLATLVPELPRELTDLVHELLSKYVDVRPTALEAANRLRVIARLLDSSTVAFSPTLQPDNVSDDELGHTLAAPVNTSTLPPTSSPPVGLGETFASIPPTRTSDAAPTTPRPATLAPATSSAAADDIARPPNPDEAASPTAEIAASTPHRHGVLAILGVVAFALSVALIVVVMRSSGDRTDVRSLDPNGIAGDAASNVDLPDRNAGDAASNVDLPDRSAIDAAPSVAVDAPYPVAVDAHAGEVAPPDAGASLRRDGGEVEPRRDGGEVEPRRDAGPRRDPGAKPDASAPPDTAKPDAAAAGSNDLDIDEHNPLKR